MSNKLPLGVIFDFNGVIVDDYPIQKQAWNEISLAIRNKNATDDEMVRKIRGVPPKNTIEWMGGYRLKSEIVIRLAKKKETITKELYLSSTLFRLNSGFSFFLDELKLQSIPRIIATSSSFDSMKFSFNKLGFARWFDVDNIVYNDGSYRGKPASDAYLLAAQKIQLPPPACVVFEDAVSGITAAFAAGVRYIVAVGTEERTKILCQLPGVVKSIRDFTEVTVQNMLLA
ncbi:HAD family phosphatase [Candidatus Roizmanbacteria bacterium]|nr:HAD family phosphatase [Candidatus Roizmanbacteria bacterium]